MDIHNTAKTPWKDMDAATKDEIERQEAGGAVVEFYSIAFYDWKQAGFSVTERLNAAYRIKPTTEIPSLPSASTRPADELDLTKLTRICGEWHPETQAAMEAWPHGYEMACGRGWHSVSSVTWIYGTCYRAKPAPTIIVNGIEVPEPVREVLKYGQRYWFVSVTATRLCSDDIWNGAYSDTIVLHRGLIHRTEAAAVAHAKAMLAPSMKGSV